MSTSSQRCDRQGRLLGRMESLGFDLRQVAVLDTLTEDVVTSSEIEGEMLDAAQVRSSVARRLGMDIGGLSHVDRSVRHRRADAGCNGAFLRTPHSGASSTTPYPDPGRKYRSLGVLKVQTCLLPSFASRFRHHGRRGLARAPLAPPSHDGLLHGRPGRWHPSGATGTVSRSHWTGAGLLGNSLLPHGRPCRPYLSG